jgi:hypothetical protein
VLDIPRRQRRMDFGTVDDAGMDSTSTMRMQTPLLHLYSSYLFLSLFFIPKSTRRPRDFMSAGTNCVIESQAKTGYVGWTT